MRSDWRPESLGHPSFLSLVPVAAAVSILTPRLCHCLYQGILPPGTLCVLYAEGQEDRCEVQGPGHPGSREGKGSTGQLDTGKKTGLKFLGAGPQMGRSSALWLDLGKQPGSRMPKDRDKHYFVAVP